MKLVWQLIRRLSSTLRLRLDSPIFCPLGAAPSKIAVATGLKSTLKSQLLQPRELTMFWASKHWKISPRKVMCSSFSGLVGGLSPKSASLQLLSHVVICWLSFISLVYIGVSLFCRCGGVFVCRMLSSFSFGMLSPPTKKWQGHDYNMFWPQPVLTRFILPLSPGNILGCIPVTFAVSRISPCWAVAPTPTCTESKASSEGSKTAPPCHWTKGQTTPLFPWNFGALRCQTWLENPGTFDGHWIGDNPRIHCGLPEGNCQVSCGADLMTSRS